MSLRINTNVSAMTALRNLGMAESDFSKSITRLSTGLRINSAADDPAGLIISEGLRSQIRGLNQAISNSQDAISLAKTAEGALNEVSTLLNNIRGLAVHSANSAVADAAQLQANQSQIRSTLDSIHRIATQTSWGEKKLLNGAAGTTAGITQTNLVQSLYVGSTMNGQTVRSGSITINRVTAAEKATTGQLATTFANAAAPVNAGTFVLNGQTFTVPTGASVGDVVNMINQQSDRTKVLASFVPTQGVVLTSTQFGSNFRINYTETSTILNGGVPAAPVAGTDAVFTVTVPVEPSPATASETFTGGRGPGVDGLTLSSPSGNQLVLKDAGNAISASTLVGSLSVGSMRFQIGANADQAATFSIPNIDPDNLGVNAVPGSSLGSVDVTTTEGAQNAISIIEDAIRQVATLRGELGSFQKNFLESTVRSLGVAVENITASESQIRDADIAKEMTEFTKVQILRQSGMSVLAQASQAPQNVLQLLQR